MSCCFPQAVTFALLSSSPLHRRPQRLLFLENVLASLALQDLDLIHEVGDLHQRNWTTSSLISIQLALGNLLS